MWKRLYTAPYVIGLSLILSIISSSVSHGSGFGVFTHGASALGQANAVVAHSDTPSAVYFNPALINNLPGTQVEIGTTMIFPYRKFKSDQSGETTKTDSSTYFPSTLYLTRSFNDELSAGIGVFNPFGLGSDWGNTWEGRYIATNSEMTTYNINPVVSYRVLPRLTLAAGLNIMFLDATLEKNVNLSGMGLPDAAQKFSGDGNGLGYNLGLLFEMGHGVSIGIAYRSEVEIEADGDVSFSLPVSGLETVFPQTNGQVDITLPQQVVAGISWRVTERLVGEIGLRWEDWSSYQELKIDLEQSVAGQTSVTQAKNWKDTYSVNLGAKYKLDDIWSISAGYLYGENPIPDSTFEPAIPDSESHLFSIGTDTNFERCRLAFSYAYQLLEDRNKKNQVGADVGGTANGKYKSDLHLLAVSMSYRF